MKTANDNKIKESSPSSATACSPERPWMSLFIYLIGIGAACSVNHSWQSGAAIYVAIRCITMGYDGIHRRSNEELEKRIAALENRRAE
jgi:hypothetical protein